jgi:cytochrome P450
MYALLVAGTETTNISIPRIIGLLLDSQQYSDLKQNPQFMANCIEEGTRLTTASPLILRSIAADTELGGYQFKAGRRALLLVYNLMKQDYDSPNARVFNIRRAIPSTLKHLSFGHGAHFCLGFALAHGEIEQVLTSLLSLEQRPVVVSRSYSTGRAFPAYTKLVIQLKG